MQSSQQQQGMRDYAARVIRHKARQLVGKAGFNESDRGDLEQNMMVDVLARLPKFDASKGTPKTFVACVVERRCSTLIRYRTCAMRDYRREAFSLNERVEDEDGRTVERSELVSEEDVDPAVAGGRSAAVDEMALLDDLNTVLAGLPGSFCRLCELLRTGNTLSDAARAMGVPRTTLQDHIKKLRALFADAGLGENLHRRPSSRPADGYVCRRRLTRGSRQKADRACPVPEHRFRSEA